jgi:hypothetical protein
MPVGDAVQHRPTLEQEMAEFKGFSTVDGEISSEKLSAEEKAGAETRERANATAAAAVAAAGGEDKTKVADLVAAKEVPDDTLSDDAVKDGKLIDTNKAKTGKPAGERISELTRNWRQTQRDLNAERDARARDREDFERRLAAVERGDKSGLTGKDSGAKTQREDTQPNPNDYEFGDLDVRYIEARTRYAVRQELNASRQSTEEQRQRDAATAEGQKIAEAKTKLSEVGTAKYPDFHEVVIEGAEDGLWPLSPTMGKLLITADPEVARDIAYHLASDPKEARRVAGLSPEQQAAHFGRLEARFSVPADATTDPKTGKVKVPKAPAPPENQARGGSGSTPASADTTDFSAFERMAMEPAR